MTTTDIERIVGSLITNDLSPTQRQTVITAITENPDGVARIAATVLADPRIHAPTPVLVNRLVRGQHRARTERRNAQHLTLMERAEHLYHARRACYPDLGEEDAIDYAVSYAGQPLSRDDENELRQRVGYPPTTPAVNHYPRHPAHRRQRA